MATTVRASSQNSAATGTAVSVAAPAGTATGDLVTVVVHVNGQTTIADNNGSTPFTKEAISGDDGSGNYKPNPTAGATAAVFTRRIQAGDPSTYNFTSGLTGRWGVVAVTWQNPHPTTIFDVTPVGGDNNDAGGGVLAGTAHTITTTTPNAIDCPILCVDGGSAQTITSPGGYTVQEQVPATAQPITFDRAVIASPGATGARSFSWTTNNNYFALSFAIADIGTSAALANTAEGGAKGATVTAGNSGGASGSAFDTVTSPVGGTLAFDDGQAQGFLSIKVGTGATAGRAAVGWTSSLGTHTTIYVRAYVYVNAVMAAQPLLIQALSGLSLTGASRAAVRYNANGTLSLIDAAGSVIAGATTTTPLAVHAWNRIEAKLTLSATAGIGSCTLRIFTPADIESTTPTQEVSNSGVANLGGAADTVGFGSLASSANIGPYWIDNLAVATVTWVGPAGTTALIPATQWLAGYAYRMDAPVANPAGPANIQLSVPFPGWFLRVHPDGAKVYKPDYSDVHVTMADGITELPAVINAAKNELTVDYASMPTGQTTLYIYYGNTSASAPAGVQTLLPYDSFSEAGGMPIDSRLPDQGVAYAIHPAFTGGSAAANITNGVVRSLTTGFVLFYQPVTIPSADYSVFGDFNVKGTGAGSASIYGRLTSSASITCYRAYINGTTLFLQGVLNGAQTFQVSVAVGGGAHNIELRLTGTLIEAYRNGIQVLSQTDANISAAGYAGFHSGGAAMSDTDIVSVDNFRVEIGPDDWTGGTAQVIGANGEVTDLNSPLVTDYIWGDDLQQATLNSSVEASDARQASRRAGITTSGQKYHLLTKPGEWMLRQGVVASSTLHMRVEDNSTVAESLALRLHRLRNTGTDNADATLRHQQWVRTGWTPQEVDYYPTWTNRYKHFAPVGAVPWQTAGAIHANEIDSTEYSQFTLAPGFTTGYQSIPVPAQWVNDWQTDIYSSGMMLKDSTDATPSNNRYIAAIGPTASEYSRAILGTSGLKSFYPLDDVLSPNTIAPDEVGGAYATYAGAAYSGLGYNGPFPIATDPSSAGVFDGSTAQVTLPSQLSFAAGSSITIEWWNYVASPAPAGGAFNIGGAAAPNSCGGYAPFSDNTCYWDYGNTTTGRVTASYAGKFDKWTHVAFTYDAATNEHAIWLDGTKAGTATSTTAPTSTISGGAIGQYAGGFQKGRIARFAVYSRALGSSEIAAHIAASGIANGSVMQVDYSTVNPEQFFKRKLTTNTYQASTFAVQNRYMLLPSEDSFGVAANNNPGMMWDVFYISANGRIRRIVKNASPSFGPNGQFSYTSPGWGLHYDTITKRHWIGGSFGTGQQMALGYSEPNIAERFTWVNPGDNGLYKGSFITKNDVVYVVYPVFGARTRVNERLYYRTYQVALDTWSAATAVLSMAYGTELGLSAAIASGTAMTGAGTISLNGTPSSYPSFGFVSIDSEFFWYTGISGTTLTGVTRAMAHSVAASHSIGAIAHIDGCQPSYIGLVFDESVNVLRVACTITSMANQDYSIDTGVNYVGTSTYIYICTVQFNVNFTTNNFEDPAGNNITGSLPLTKLNWPIVSRPNNPTYMMNLLSLQNGVAVMTQAEYGNAGTTLTDLWTNRYSGNTWTRTDITDEGLNEAALVRSTPDNEITMTGVVSTLPAEVRRMVSLDQGVTFTTSGLLAAHTFAAPPNLSIWPGGILWCSNCTSEGNLRGRGLVYYQHFCTHGAVFLIGIGFVPSARFTASTQRLVRKG